MSKLSRIRELLKANRDVVVVAAEEQNHLPETAGAWSQQADLYVAPREGLYAAEELQEFMLSLFPDLKRTNDDDFHEWGENGDGKMLFGRLYFEESVGTKVVRTEYALSDEDVKPAKGFENGRYESVDTHPVRRQIRVRVFPNAEVAKAVREGRENEFSISMAALSTYRHLADHPSY